MEILIWEECLYWNCEELFWKNWKWYKIC